MPPRQVRLDELVTTKDTLQLAALLDEDSTFYGDLFAHVVEWRGELYLEDGLHRALRAALQQRNVLHARVHPVDGLMREAHVGVMIAVLGMILAIGAAWGWHAATEPFPGKAEAPTCVDRQVEQGEKVCPDQVVVSVFNAGDRKGLAGRTMDAPGRRRVPARGQRQRSATRGGRHGQIWTEEPGSPAVRLVASQLGPATKVVRRDGRRGRRAS